MGLTVGEPGRASEALRRWYGIGRSALPADFSAMFTLGYELVNNIEQAAVLPAVASGIEEP